MPNSAPRDSLFWKNLLRPASACLDWIDGALLSLEKEGSPLRVVFADCMNVKVLRPLSELYAGPRVTAYYLQMLLFRSAAQAVVLAPS